MSALIQDETCRNRSILFIAIMLLNPRSFWKTMSQVLLSWTSLTDFDLRLYQLWFEHFRFGNLLAWPLS